MMVEFVVADYDEEETDSVGNELVVDDVVEYEEEYDVMEVVVLLSLGELMEWEDALQWSSMGMQCLLKSLELLLMTNFLMVER